MMVHLSPLLILATVLQLRTAVAAGYIQLDTVRKRDANAPPTVYDRMVKRADPHEWTLTNQDNYYYLVNITVGDPPQEFQAHLDTGSSDLWVIDKDNPLCAKTDEQYRLALQFIDYTDCNQSGTFDPDASTTLDMTDEDFFVQYADTRAAEGKFAHDDVTVAGATIKQMKLGVAETTNCTMIIGIGLPSNEYSVLLYNSEPYPNLPARMAQEGLINTNAYSLWLNDVNENKGSVLFGGVDHAKYDGTLQTLPIVDVAYYPPKSSLAVMMSGLTVSPQKDDSDPVQLFSGNIAVTLDSGAAMSYLPYEVVNEIGTALDAEFDFTTEMYYTRCNYEGYFEFEFNGFTIKAPFSDFLTPAPSSDGGYATYSDGTPMCSIGMKQSSYSDGPYSLGDSFLRNAYVVYDLDRMEISLAQAKFGVSDSDIDPIDSNGVPSATRAQGYDQTATAAVLSMETIPANEDFTLTGQPTTLDHTEPPLVTGGFETDFSFDTAPTASYSWASPTFSSFDFSFTTISFSFPTFSLITSAFGGPPDFSSLDISDFGGPTGSFPSVPTSLLASISALRNGGGGGGDSGDGTSTQNRDALRATVALAGLFAVVTTGLIVY
uniref:ARAD1B15884p n=1 Tax=Blastobotrys adeninivorans TaxID=409370 RepID=A0A060TCE1_BLAAD